MALPSKPVFSVPVRALVDFALRTGDLGGEKDFVGRNRALAGIRGHQQIQKSRPPTYQKEVNLACDVESSEFTLRIVGRIDGLLRTAEGVTLEEIKTTQGGWNGSPDPLHWAQAKIYGFIYARENSIGQMDLQLTYLDLDSGRIEDFHETISFDELSSFFERTTAIYVEWIAERYRWCQLRDRSLCSAPFPFLPYRSGQRALAVAAYRTLTRGGRVFLEAPTGIGKTMSVLFPAVRALGESKVDRIFYLTARTPGREAAHKCFGDLRRAGLRLRTLPLTARDKLCIRDGGPCELQTCPWALGYYDRRKAAMREALDKEDISRATLEEVSRAHRVCPYELSLDLSLWVDAVVCDYNYVFDPQVYLRRHFGDEGGRSAFLVDEAHNLVDRAREMFSAQLDGQELGVVRRAIKTDLRRCAKALGKLSQAMRELGEEEGSSMHEDVAQGYEDDLFSAQASLSARRPQNPQERTPALRVRREAPVELIPPLETVLKEAELWLARNEPAEFRPQLLELYFQLFSFKRTVDSYDERYVTLVEAGSAPKVRLFCVDPSFLLREALNRSYAAIFFSATLTPLDYYQSLLGGSAEDPVLRLPAPFPPENLAVLIHGGIRTNFKARASTFLEVVHAVAALVSGKRGNYLVYFPSYQYLTDVLQQFQAFYPHVQVCVQFPGMTELQRERFLEAFGVEHTQTLLGFALMGGVFGEAIDLVGDRLIGAVIVGVGLPQLCIERDLIRDYFQKTTGSGFEYAYMYPGLNRVLQATGRVIRSETDKGVVLLIDQRFNETRYQRAFPPKWRSVEVKTIEEIETVVGRFWSNDQ